MNAIDLTKVFNSIELDESGLRLYDVCIKRGLKKDSSTQISVIYCEEEKKFTVAESMRNGIKIKVKELLHLKDAIKNEEILFHCKNDDGKHLYNWKQLPCFII